MRKNSSFIDRTLSLIVLFLLDLSWFHATYIQKSIWLPISYWASSPWLWFCLLFRADGINVPALESSSSSESLATFRNVIAAENEAEIYQRILVLENQNFYGLPPQNQGGQYERIVREHFDQAINVDHFRRILDMEWASSIRAKGPILQDRLFNLLISEQNLERILELSPYNDIRKVLIPWGLYTFKFPPPCLSASSHGWKSYRLYSRYRPER